MTNGIMISRYNKWQETMFSKNVVSGGLFMLLYDTLLGNVYVIIQYHSTGVSEIENSTRFFYKEVIEKKIMLGC